jgi:hypothetical protein
VFLSRILPSVNDQRDPEGQNPARKGQVFFRNLRNPFRYGRDFGYNETIGNMARGRGIEWYSNKERREMKKWGLICLLLVSLLTGVFGMGEAAPRDLVKFGRNLVIKEDVRVHDAVAIGGQVTVEGEVERNVVAVAGSVFLASGAKVGGDVISIGGIIEKEEGAQVQGDQVEVALPGLSSFFMSLSQGNWHELSWIFRLISIIASIGFMALALMVVLLIPAPVGMVSATVEKNTLKAAGWGLLAVFLIVPVAVLLAVSIIGIVLIPVEIIFVVCALLMGYIAVAQLLGKKITLALRKPNRPIFWETLWGLVILWVIGLIPVLGGLVKSAAGLLGLGGVIFSLLKLRKG